MLRAGAKFAGPVHRLLARMARNPYNNWGRKEDDCRALTLTQLKGDRRVTNWTVEGGCGWRSPITYYFPVSTRHVAVV